MVDLNTIASWSEPKEVQTKYGPRILRKASVPASFWDLWRAQKDDLKKAGINVGKNLQDEWELTWWQELPDEVKERRAQAIEESRAASADLDLPCPAGLDYMPFQKAGIRYALNRPAVLIADEMGLGKTIQSIGVINADPNIRSVIIVCPKSLKLNWKAELQKWLVRPMDIEAINGGWVEADIIILNYESLGKYEFEIQARMWDLCIVDEAHYIKNGKAKRSQAVKAIASDRVLRLTGTPIVNRPIELYNLIDDLAPDEFGQFFKFAKRYCGACRNPYSEHWDFGGATNLDELQRRLRETIMVRRLKADVLTELPPKIRQVVLVEATTAAQRRCVAAEQGYEEESEDRLADLRARVELSKAESDEAYRRAVNDLDDATSVDFTAMARLRHDTAVSKIPAIVDHVRNCLEDNDQKIVIAAHHHDVIDGLMEELAEFHPVKLMGDTKEADRYKAVYEFQHNPAVRIFVASIQAAGVGITLTAASHVVFAELDWVPGNISQMEDRCHRIGQHDIVLIQHLVLDGSLDARMAHFLIDKQRIIDSALDEHHPERTRPVFEPKKERTAATKSVTPAAIQEEAVKLTATQVAAVHQALLILAGMDDDFASEINGVGFNKVDGMIGHSLAEQNSLSPRQAALGLRIVRKYHRQLPEDLMHVLKGEA